MLLNYVFIHTDGDMLVHGSNSYFLFKRQKNRVVCKQSYAPIDNFDSANQTRHPQDSIPTPKSHTISHSRLLFSQTSDDPQQNAAALFTKVDDLSPLQMSLKWVLIYNYFRDKRRSLNTTIAMVIHTNRVVNGVRNSVCPSSRLTRLISALLR